MTSKAHQFLMANEQSPVVYGSVIGRGGRGCHYRLQDGRNFRLGAKDCKDVGHPRWQHMAAAR